ncbi:MAG: hypothetical protein EA353_12500 [Puniceicoccaceae bacterium]|nr:MAG: hypothetical protein EA353_12500 [Puniceicoccaceae bacterium]
MKRSRAGLLIQGSIDRAALPDTFPYGQFASSLYAMLATALALPAGALEDIRPLFNSQQIEDSTQRFRSQAWNERR